MNPFDLKKILVVDDELPIQKILKRFLENAGYKCAVASNVAEAKEKLKEDSYSLLLSDLMMPGETGLDLIKHAKVHHPEVGRIMITAYGEEKIAREIMQVGVYGYIIKPLEKQTVLITVENALRHLFLDQHMQACLEEMKKKISSRTEKLDAIMKHINVGIILVDKNLRILETNAKMKEFFPSKPDTKQAHCYNYLISDQLADPCPDCPMLSTLREKTINETSKQIQTLDGPRDFRVISSPVINQQGEVYAGVAIYEDITERNNLERDLHQAQKLEAVGQLAAGIAHEINSPIQYIGDNIRFLNDSLTDINLVYDTYNQLWNALKEKETIPEEMDQKMADTLEEADFEYLMDEIPVTIKQSLDGVERVDKIVRAMKDFSHPGDEEKTLTDIHQIIENTVTVCKNEWKYVAEIDFDLAADMPLIPCYPGDLSQVFLNIIVNGSHAISEKNDGGKNGLGRINITTSHDTDYGTISIKDSGTGIPQKIIDKIFEPFFTTKKRGKGTGQGLAISHRVVIGKHNGQLRVNSIPGEGSNFIISLPLVSEIE